MPTKEIEIHELQNKVAVLEYQIQYLFEKLSIEIPEAPVEGLTPEIMYLVQKGDKIKAMKLYMQETGYSIREAQVFVDSLAD